METCVSNKVPGDTIAAGTGPVSILLGTTTLGLVSHHKSGFIYSPHSSSFL